MKSRALLSFAFVVIFPACSRQPESRNHSADSVCLIVAAPERFDGRIVTVKAYILADGLEHSLTVDSVCPGAGIALIGGTNDADASVRELKRTIHRSAWQLPSVKISGVFTGRFLWRAKEKPVRAMQLIRVTDMKLSSTSSSH